MSPAVSATVTPAQSTTVTPRGAVAAESDASLKTKKEAAEPSPKKEEGAISSPRAPDAAPSEVLVEAVENTEIVPAEEGDTIVAQPRPPPAVASTPDEEIVLLRAQLKQQEEQLQKLMSRVEGAASDGSGSQRSAEGATAGAPAATGSKHHPVKRILQPETIPEMEVLEDNQMSSDFTLRMKRPSTLAARGRSKSSVIHSKRRDPDKLSDEMRLFMTTWREAREHEIRSTIVEDLRRAYIKLAKEDEECKEFNLVLTSLADIEGTSKGVCEYLRHRLRGSFKVVPEEVVLVRPMALPGQVAAAAADAAGLASGGWVAGLDDAGLATASAADSLLNDTTSSEPDVEGRARESLLDGHVTRKRFRHELARALRSHDDHPCVRVLIQNEKPAKMAYQGAERDLDKDLFDINHFCDKYGNLDRWARNTAKLEAHGIRQVVHFLQEPASDKGRAEHGPAFMLGAPKDQRSDNDVAMIETSRDFLSFFFTGDEEMKHKADISRLGRMDACNWVKAVLAKRNQLQQDKDKDAMGSDPDHVFDPASLLVNSDPCAFAPTHLMRPRRHPDRINYSVAGPLHFWRRARRSLVQQDQSVRLVSRVARRRTRVGEAVYQALARAFAQGAALQRRQPVGPGPGQAATQCQGWRRDCQVHRHVRGAVGAAQGAVLHVGAATRLARCRQARRRPPPTQRQPGRLCLQAVYQPRQRRRAGGP